MVYEKYDSSRLQKLKSSHTTYINDILSKVIYGMLTTLNAASSIFTIMKRDIIHMRMTNFVINYAA